MERTISERGLLENGNGVGTDASSPQGHNPIPSISFSTEESSGILSTVFQPQQVTQDHHLQQHQLSVGQQGQVGGSGYLTTSPASNGQHGVPYQV